mgnify:CR=1 FL=1
MKWFLNGLWLSLVLALLVSCGGLPPTPTEDASHDLAVIRPSVGSLPTLTPVPRHYLPLIQLPSPTPTSTPTQLPGKQPVGGGHTFPPYSTSLYMKTLDSSTLYNMGCELGVKDLNTPGAQDSLVILAYGYPKYVDGVYGTRFYGTTIRFVTLEQIKFATLQFAWGYYTCTGTDFASHLRIGIGTSNYEGDNPAVNFAHGAAWGEMVNAVNAWLVQNGASGQVDAVGASDIELSWNDYVETKDWLDGYDSVNQYDLYNFGAIPGCPTLSRPGAQCGTYPHLWSREQVWYVIYGAGPVYPLPEIYLTDGTNAEQWYMMSTYSVTAHGAPVGFVGSLTTYQACQQVGGCNGPGWDLRNTPQQGWTQLYTLLNGNPRTAQGLRWASDMKWTSATVSAGVAAALNPAPVGDGTAAQAEALDRLQANLQAEGLSDTLRLGLQEKLAAAQWAERIRQQGVVNPAPKNQMAALALPMPTPAPAPEAGEAIVAGSDGLITPALADIQNTWLGLLGDEEIAVLAGAQSGDASQGVLIILRGALHQPEMTGETFLAPAGVGSLRIVARQDSELMLESASGAALRFDLAEKRFK